eukprot:6565561-Karenia_brevis.AAC.1
MATKHGVAWKSKQAQEVPGEEEKPQMGYASELEGMATKASQGMATKQHGMASKHGVAWPSKHAQEVPYEEERPQMGITSVLKGMATKASQGMATKRLKVDECDRRLPVHSGVGMATKTFSGYGNKAASS